MNPPLSPTISLTPVGPWPRLEALPGWQAIEFISDLHLSEDTPATFEALSRHLSTTSAEAVVLLGDVFEAWPGDDARLDGAFEAGCIDMLRRAADRLDLLGFMVGNRDFLFGPDAMRDAGMTGLADPTVMEAFGVRALLTHGDGLCLDDTAYQRFRAMVRDPAWQRQVLAQPLSARRQLARQLREQSETRQHPGAARTDDSIWADADPAEASRWLQAGDARVLIHGHTHRPGSGPFADGAVRHVLSDWDLDHAPHRAEVLRWTASGFNRIPLDAIDRPGD